MTARPAWGDFSAQGHDLSAQRGDLGALPRTRPVPSPGSRAVPGRNARNVPAAKAAGECPASRGRSRRRARSRRPWRVTRSAGQLAPAGGVFERIPVSGLGSAQRHAPLSDLVILAGGSQLIFCGLEHGVAADRPGFGRGDLLMTDALSLVVMRRFSGVAVREFRRLGRAIAGARRGSSAPAR